MASKVVKPRVIWTSWTMRSMDTHTNCNVAHRERTILKGSELSVAQRSAERMLQDVVTGGCGISSRSTHLRISKEKLNDRGQG